LTDADFGGEVDDAVDARQRVGNHVLVANVADDEFGIGRKVVRALSVAVNLLDQAVENTDPVTAAKKLARD